MALIKKIFGRLLPLAKGVTWPFLWETLKIIILSLLIILPIRYFIMQPFFVRGASMEPNFENGEYLIIDELSYFFRQPVRGEVIVFKFPKNTREYYIKRVVGLPDETVQINNGKVTIFNKDNPQGLTLKETYLDPNLLTPGSVKITLGLEEYFVLGDNRFASSDSRRWGVLPEKDLVGRVFVRVFPLSRFQLYKLKNAKNN